MKTTSKIFRIDWFDALKGLLVAVVSAALYVIMQVLQSEGHLDWKATGILAGRAAGAAAAVHALTDQQLGGEGSRNCVRARAAREQHNPLSSSLG